MIFNPSVNGLDLYRGGRDVEADLVSLRNGKCTRGLDGSKAVETRWKRLRVTISQCQGQWRREEKILGPTMGCHIGLLDFTRFKYLVQSFLLKLSSDFDLPRHN